MKYQGQNVIVKTLRNKDLVALGQAIESLNKEIVAIHYSVSNVLDHNVEYTAIIITKE